MVTLAELVKHSSVRVCGKCLYGGNVMWSPYFKIYICRECYKKEHFDKN